MMLPPPTLPQTVNLVHVRVSQTLRGDPADRARQQRLAALDGRREWRAAVLALMATPDSAVDWQAWASLVPAFEGAEQLVEDVVGLPETHRLPWFEHFARCLAPGPVQGRHELVGAARSLLTADGIVTAMDQLRWIALRHLLAGSAVAPPSAAPNDFETLDVGQVNAICVYCAFLSQLVPTPEVHFDPTGFGSVSQSWYDTVTAPWGDRTDLLAREGHDIDAALRALRDLQAMPWLLRPMLVRSWFDAARALTDGPQLHSGAADALRLSCVLLDSPMPPELGEQYVEVPQPARQ
jgi:hypothetical protein